MEVLLRLILPLNQSYLVGPSIPPLSVPLVLGNECHWSSGILPLDSTCAAAAPQPQPQPQSALPSKPGKLSIALKSRRGLLPLLLAVHNLHNPNERPRMGSDTMEQRTPPEFMLDAFADPNSVRDVVKGSSTTSSLPCHEQRLHLALCHSLSLLP